jgi:hypothetical protein
MSNFLETVKRDNKQKGFWNIKNSFFEAFLAKGNMMFPLKCI